MPKVQTERAADLLLLRIHQKFIRMDTIPTPYYNAIARESG